MRLGKQEVMLKTKGNKGTGWLTVGKQGTLLYGTVSLVISFLKHKRNTMNAAKAFGLLLLQEKGIIDKCF